MKKFKLFITMMLTIASIYTIATIIDSSNKQNEISYEISHWENWEK